MLDDFNFSAVDQPSFKEDAVREEIITPILHALGYKATGDLRIKRSKKLIHPFVMIGSKKHKINIIPDYTIYDREKPLLVLEAKAPDEAIIKSKAVEQAYSYAIHAEVRSGHYALCNGKQLVLFEVQRFDPVFVIDCKDIPSRADEVRRHFDPRTLNDPVIHQFKPDYGILASKFGLSEHARLLINGLYMNSLFRPTDQIYSTQGTCATESGEYLVSLDFNPEVLSWIIDSLPAKQDEQIRAAFTRQPYCIELSNMITLAGEAKLGNLINGPHEDYIPWILTAFDGAEYHPENFAPQERDPAAIKAGVPILTP